MTGPAPNFTSAHANGTGCSPLFWRASFSRATSADVDAGDFAVDVEAVEAGGASDDVDTSGEGCALEGGGVPEHLDYRVWNVAYADGTSVRFDSVLGEALID